MKRIAFLVMMMLALSTMLFAQPAPCGQDPAMSSFCNGACVICDIDGFTGRNDLTVQGQGFPNFCTTQYHNMSYIAFIAGTVDLTIEVSVSNCNINWGLEIGLFESSNCDSFDPVSICDTDVEPNTTVSLSNTQPLIVGQHYYLIMDGSNSDICDWTINVVEGSTAVGVLEDSGEIEGELDICANFLSTYSSTGVEGATFYNWTIKGIPQDETTQSIELQFPDDAEFEVCVSAANVCDEAPPTCVIVTVRTPEVLMIDEVLCENDCLEVAGQTLCETGSYDFVVIMPNGCDSLIFVELEVLPQAQDFVDVNLCVGDEFLIGSTPYFTTGIHVDTVLTASECDSIVTLDLFMIECEIIASTDFVPPICFGENNGMLVFSVENGTPPFTYDWSNILDPTINGNGITNLFLNNQINDVPAGIYEINIMDNFGNDVVIFQEVTEPPPLSVSADALFIGEYNLSCYGGSDGEISAVGQGGVAPYVFYWSNNMTGEEIANLSAGSYTVSIEDNRSCVQVTQIDLVAPPDIVSQILFEDPSCEGLETGFIVIEGIIGGTEPFQSSIDSENFDDTAIYSFLDANDYIVNIQDDNGCLDTIYGTLSAPDIPILYMEPELIVDLGCDILIPVATNTTELIDISWDDSSKTLDCNDCLEPLASPVNTQKYVLTVTSVDDCSTSDSVTVRLNKVRDVFIPNLFTPNDDNVNDVFEFSFNKSVDRVLKFSIYNRWGEKVFNQEDVEVSDPALFWDGTFKGKSLNPGVYCYSLEIEYLDGLQSTYLGNVTIFK